MQIAICDDEPLALNTLKNKIQTYMNTKQINCTIIQFPDGESLLTHITDVRSHLDAIYLDIRMNHINGIDTAKAIRKKDSKIFIVFVTALKEYVYDAFDVNAANFLLKPIDDNKLFSSLDKIAAQASSYSSKSLVIQANKKIEIVAFEKIVYCEVLNHNLFVYGKDFMHEYSGKIAKLAQELNEDFFRCHRSYLVNLKYVESYKDGFAYLPNSEKIPIATRRRQSFLQALLRSHRNEVR